jgi:hypothetical protein
MTLAAETKIRAWQRCWLTLIRFVEEFSFAGLGSEFQVIAAL